MKDDPFEKLDYVQDSVAGRETGAHVDVETVNMAMWP